MLYSEFRPALGHSPAEWSIERQRRPQCHRDEIGRLIRKRADGLHKLRARLMNRLVFRYSSVKCRRGEAPALRLPLALQSTGPASNHLDALGCAIARGS